MASFDTMEACSVFYDDDGELHADDGPAVVFPDGSEMWFQHGACHRVGGPAVISTRGWSEMHDPLVWVCPGDAAGIEEYWFENGELHRVGGPATVTSLGAFFFQRNRLHRTDGPATVWEGRPSWFLFGYRLSDEQVELVSEWSAEVFQVAEGLFDEEAMDVARVLELAPLVCAPVAENTR